MKLLVSIVNAGEVAPALEGGTDILDVKNPLEGALGANFPHVIRAIRAQAPESVPVSVAIGDAPFKPGATALAALGAACCGVEYIKVGLHGTRTADQGRELLTAVCRAVKDHSPRTRVIAAAYADAEHIGAFPVLETPAVAADAKVDGCMVDTAGKGGGTLFSHMGMDALEGFISDCRNRGLISALAGSLTLADIPRAAALQPDILGFRGAACGGDRTGSIDPRAVVRLRAALDQVG